MTTTIIQNSCVCGAIAGLMAGRYIGSFTPTDYSRLATVARAIANEFITENAASSSPMSDSDNPQIDSIVQSVAMATIINSGATSITPNDYLSYGQQIYAASKEALTELLNTQFFGGYMVENLRTGCEVPFPEYANLTAGSGYITLPEPDIETLLFELTVISSEGGTINVIWADERHIGTHDVPATGIGTLINNALSASIVYGSYTINITGNIVGTSFAGTVITTVAAVTEIYEIIIAGPTSTLTFPPNCQYYSQSGNDSNNGLSFKAPKLTLPIPNTNDNLVIDRRFIFTVGEYLAHELQFNAYGRGCGARPIFNEFVIVSTWINAGSGAWSCQVTGDITVDVNNAGNPTVIENGNLLQPVADLSTVQSTPGSYTNVGHFAPGGATVTVYLHTTDGSNPNTNGRVYEVSTGELGLAGRGSCIFESFICRGNTATRGPVSSHPLATDGSDYAIFSNIISSFGQQRNFSGYGFKWKNCISFKLQRGTFQQQCSHVVLSQPAGYTNPVRFDSENCALIGEKTLGTFNDTGIVMDIQGGTLPIGPVSHSQLYIAFLGGPAFAQNTAVNPCEVDDLLAERFLVGQNIGIFTSGNYVVKRARYYALAAPYLLGPLLTNGSTQSFAIYNSLLVSGEPPPSQGKGLFLLTNSTDPSNPTVLIAEHNTFVRIGTANNVTPCVEWDCSGTNVNGQFTWNYNAISGFGFAFETIGALSVPPQPQRLTSDFNSWGNYVNSFVYGFSSISIANTFYAIWQSGNGIWTASDSNSVAAAVTFSNTTGRYPAYTKTSSGPGGYTQTFLDPTIYLGVQFITTLEAAGQYPI